MISVKWCEMYLFNLSLYVHVFLKYLYKNP